MTDKKPKKETTYEMDIYKQSSTTWIITTANDRILVTVFDGDLEFYRAADIDDIS